MNRNRNPSKQLKLQENYGLSKDGQKCPSFFAFIKIYNIFIKPIDN